MEQDSQLRQPRLAEMVAGVLRGRIVGGVLADGSRLPKQEDLLKEFRISRPSLREALQILEAEGLLTVQRGNVGGAIVRSPNAGSAAYTFGLVLQSRQVPVSDLAHALLSVEPVAAALCARRRDRRRAVVPAMKQSLKEAESAIGDVRFTALSRRFHEQIVQRCGNETLIVLLGALEAMWSSQEREWARRAGEAGSYPSSDACEAALAAHRSLVNAIEDGDEVRAARIVGAHLEETQTYALSGDGREVVRAVPVGGTGHFP